MEKLGNLVQGKYTKAAQEVYLAIFENRDWDCYCNHLDGNRGIYNDVTQGNRAVQREEWF